MLQLALAAAATPPPIEHVVLLVMENRPYDFYFGWNEQQKAAGGNVLTGDEFNYFDTKDPSKGKLGVQKGKANYVCKDGSDMSFGIYDKDIFGPNTGWNGSSAPYPKPTTWGTGYLEVNKGNAEVMAQMSPEQVPVKTALAAEFATFDDWHAAFPGPSTPNHLFLQTATAYGCTETGATYKCKAGGLFPQKTIYESLAAQNKTWAYYYNDSAWNSFLEFFHTKEGQAGMLGYDTFYDQARKGTLPSFSWILPRQGHNKTTGQGSNDDHPCHDIALGERLLKDTYEAVRAGPGWEKTVMIVTYDDPGGWFDHGSVPTGVPRPDNMSMPSCPDDADYTWLGARVPTLLISPWVQKGRVIHSPKVLSNFYLPRRLAYLLTYLLTFRILPPSFHPSIHSSFLLKGPASDSVYEHSSIPASLKDIFGLPNFLTKRDAWAGSVVSELTEATARSDCLMHAPEAPPPTPTWRESDETEALLLFAEQGYPGHCSALASPRCADPRHANKKQRQRMKQWSEVNGVVAPLNPTQDEADDWITEQFHAFRTGMLSGE